MDLNKVIPLADSIFLKDKILDKSLSLYDIIQTEINPFSLKPQPL